MKDEFANSKENVRKIKPKFAYTQLKDVLESIEILYDNKNGNTSYDEDKELAINYQIDTTDLMCSRTGEMNERIYKELRRHYLKQ